ncbi:MAG: superfamily II DNA/RNA helicase [Candidatus Phytoplasma cynodontis]|uniref:DEAD/DEAH box helicase n=1 Tax='Cynodon dactylon' phytoplasma TaxID=295320 RepID=UPI001265BD90|nr:DEAD/DEAH box helicase ['Cynodon dactylon' phytoplasma]KAB8122012.1 DEAD/DEAH box helicase ['Cynodon dactylon' phytoplasma]WIA07572.1 MAG: superfamily II DNA/RNA helicase [Candidatus Phytoplasma cynodontis]
MEKYIQEKIEKLNFKQITPIQKEIFKNFETKSNLVCISPTGTGKTHAYLLPILSKIKWNKDIVQAVIVVPTNELVFQIFEMITKIENQKNKIKIFFGGMNKIKTNSQLDKKQPIIIIATLNKLFEYVYILKKINIHKSSFFILDEADMFFEQKSLPLIKNLLSKWKPKILLLSASLTKNMKSFINKHFGKSIFIDVNNKSKLNLNFYAVESSEKNRLKDLLFFLYKINPFLAFIFISKKKEQPYVYKILKNKKMNVLDFSSYLSVKERRRKIIEIKKNKYQYIVTTDIASRGLDIKDISWIIHYDLPNKNLDFFKHRSGRAGRMGKEGNVILFYEQKEKELLLKIEKKNNIKFKKISLRKSQKNDKNW